MHKRARKHKYLVICQKVNKSAMRVIRYNTRFRSILEDSIKSIRATWFPLTPVPPTKCQICGTDLTAWERENPGEVVYERQGKIVDRQQAFYCQYCVAKIKKGEF